MELTEFFILLLIFILIVLIFYYGFSPVIITNNQEQQPQSKQKQNQELKLPYPTNHSLYPSDINITNPGYQNEVIIQDEYLKDGDYTKQFKEVDIKNLPKPNTQIGFNPEPKEMSKELPFADVHINYLLKK